MCNISFPIVTNVLFLYSPLNYTLSFFSLFCSGCAVAQSVERGFARSLLVESGLLYCDRGDTEAMVSPLCPYVKYSDGSLRTHPLLKLIRLYCDMSFLFSLV